MGGEIGGVFWKILLLIAGIMIVYNMIFDPAALRKIPQDISAYINSWTHTSKAPSKHK